MKTFAELRASAPIYDHLVTAFGSNPAGHPNYEKNADKTAYSKEAGIRFNPDRSECCVYCGKYCGAIGKFAVYLLNTSEISEAEHFEGNDGDNLCMYPLGSDCAKKFKKLGVPYYHGESLERVK